MKRRFSEHALHKLQRKIAITPSVL